MPAHATSTGKVLLATLDRDVLRRRLRDWQPVQLTPYTIMSERVPLAALARVAERGWAQKVEEGTLGPASVATPIMDATGETVAASVVAPVRYARLPRRARQRGDGEFAPAREPGARPPTGIGRAGRAGSDAGGSAIRTPVREHHVNQNQARATVASPLPRCAANNRLDQCVTPSLFK